MLPSRQRTRSAPRNSTRFAAQYSTRGLPCERFTAVLTDRTSCITRGRGGWLDLPRGGLTPPILCPLSWRTLLWVIWTKSGRLSLRTYWSHPPTGADVLGGSARQGRRVRLVQPFRRGASHRRSARCHYLEHVADLQSPAACQHHERDTLLARGRSVPRGLGESKTKPVRTPKGHAARLYGSRVS
jgi:hypothetical protein